MKPTHTLGLVIDEVGAFLSSPGEQAEVSPCTDRGRCDLYLGLLMHFQDPSAPQLWAEWGGDREAFLGPP